MENKPTAEELAKVLEYIRDNWENAWMRYIIRESLKGNFDWRD